MPILKKICEYCNKKAKEITHETVGKNRIIHLECGHDVIEELIELKDSKSLVFKDGRKPFPYQANIIDKSATQANHRYLNRSHTGTGKTIMSIGEICLYPELLPVAVLCKAKLKLQWMEEIHRLTGEIAQVIERGNDVPISDYFKVFIVSLDMIKGYKYWDQLDVKTVIIDECQLIKNPDSKRTQAVRKFCDGKEYIIALSATPIKKHAAEFFPILNILRPEMFPSFANFTYNWVDQYWTGYGNKYGGIKKERIKEFQELTSDFIFGVTREEALPDLPKIFRTQHFVNLGDEVAKAYVKCVEDLEEEFSKHGGNLSFAPGSNPLAIYARMRHLTGLAKIDQTVDFVTDFLLENDNKIVLFVHHTDVGQQLVSKLTEVCLTNGIKPPLSFTSDLDPRTWYEQDLQFRNDPETRVIVASTLSGGEGGNWQVCGDCIIVEQQWNPDDETQAEGRFPRPGSLFEKVNSNYMIALGTIDEFLAELKAEKRANCQTAYGHENVDWHEDSMLKEVANRILAAGTKRWKDQIKEGSEKVVHNYDRT